MFVGVVTIARIHTINNDDLRWVIAMNRIRNVYLELHPELDSFPIGVCVARYLGHEIDRGLLEGAGPKIPTASALKPGRVVTP